VETDSSQLKRKRQSSVKEKDSGILDTVGAVVLDHKGNVAAAVSSAGLALKHPSRVGRAALYECGSWAENTGAHNSYSTASLWYIKNLAVCLPVSICAWS
jgi:taspase (threonine aspartase 1)